MENVFYKDGKIITPLVGDGKNWIRIQHDIAGTSDFLPLTKRRTQKGSLVMEAALEGNHVLHICNGSERAVMRLKDGVISKLEAWQVSKCFPAPKKLKVTIEVDLENKDLIEELLVKLKEVNK